eukprot:TRINITY_DN24666_c0_g4_i1.p1 TRINITY_DN24666_c0_g4~~TRINITY_DN24666_c0_g4_i1.p1  ORF type:complete len:163 (-),score=12.19 TRINITY_DN24666_c0_g4_i1:87-575(-)
MQDIRNVQRSLRKWFRTTESDIQFVYIEMRKKVNAMLHVLNNVKFVEGQSTCSGFGTLMEVHQILPGHVVGGDVEGVEVCGPQEGISHGHFVIHVCPAFWWITNLEPERTILHEVSHVLCAFDYTYCSIGLACQGLPPPYARKNADNYAYFVYEVYFNSFLR